MPRPGLSPRPAQRGRLDRLAAAPARPVAWPGSSIAPLAASYIRTAASNRSASGLSFQAARSRSMVSMSARSLNAAGSVARRWASFGLAWMVSSTDTSACTCCSRREFRLLRCGPAGFYLLAQALGQVDQVVHPARNVGRFLAQLLEQLLVDDLGQIGRLGLALLGCGLIQFKLGRQILTICSARIARSRSCASTVGNDVLAVPRLHDGFALLLGSCGGCRLLLPVLAGAGRRTADIALGVGAGLGAAAPVPAASWLCPAGHLAHHQLGQRVVRHAEGSRNISSRLSIEASCVLSMLMSSCS